MIPQLIYLSLVLIGLGAEIARHGEAKKGKYNGWTSLIATLIILTVLYYGGFFDVFKPFL